MATNFFGIGYHLKIFRSQPKKKLILCPASVNFSGEGGLSCERGGDACWKFGIKPPKETNLGVAQPFLSPKRDHDFKHRQII